MKYLLKLFVNFLKDYPTFGNMVTVIILFIAKLVAPRYLAEQIRLREFESKVNSEITQQIISGFGSVKEFNARVKFYKVYMPAFAEILKNKSENDIAFFKDGLRVPKSKIFA